MHLRTCYGTVKVQGEERFYLCTSHDYASTCAWPGRTVSGFAACGRLPSPTSGSNSLTNDSRRLFSASRPLMSRDLTVPSETCNTSAISSYDSPSMSRSTTVVRYGSETCFSSFSTRARISSCSKISRGDSPRSTSVSHRPKELPSQSSWASMEVSLLLCRNHQRLWLEASWMAIRYNQVFRLHSPLKRFMPRNTLRKTS